MNIQETELGEIELSNFSLIVLLRVVTGSGTQLVSDQGQIILQDTKQYRIQIYIIHDIHFVNGPGSSQELSMFSKSQLKSDKFTTLLNYSS